MAYAKGPEDNEEKKHELLSDDENETVKSEQKKTSPSTEIPSKPSFSSVTMLPLFVAV